MPPPQAQSGAAAKPAGGETPQIKVRTELVLVPVLVQDKSGKHIPGLTKDKFRMEENGRPQQVGLFEEVRTERASVEARPPAEQGHSNFVLGASKKDWRVTIVVLDMINTPFLQQGETKRQLTLFLSRSLRSEEPTTLLGLSHKGLVQLHPFTTDTQVLIQALKKTRGETTRTEQNLDQSDALENMADVESTALDSFMDAQDMAAAFQQRDAIHQTLEAMKRIAQAYAAIPGRKTLIWATGGFPFFIDDPMAFGRFGADMVQDYEDTWRLLSAANIAVYPVDAMGLVNPYFSAGGGFSAGQRNPSIGRMRAQAQGRQYNRQAELEATMRAFANATGGRPCISSNEMEKCFATAVEDASAYYLLGFYLTEDDRKPGWRKLKVQVDAQGAHVRAREGFYVGGAKQDTPEARHKEIVDALGSAVEYTGVLIRLRWLPQQPLQAPPNAEAKIACDYTAFLTRDTFTIDQQQSNSIDLTLMTLVLDKNFKPVADPLHTTTGNLKPEVVQQILAANGIGLREHLELAKGSYQVRVLVRDNPSGRIGTVIVPLEVK